MTIENYELTLEQASKVPQFYYPGQEGYIDCLKFESREDNRPNPRVLFSVEQIPKSKIIFTLHPNKPLIQFVDISGEENDIDEIREICDGALETKLEKSKNG